MMKKKKKAAVRSARKGKIEVPVEKRRQLVMVESGNPEPFERLAVPQTQGHCPWGFNDPHEERDVSTRWCAMSR